MAVKRTLGRGISAILDEVEEAYAADIRAGNAADLVMNLHVDEIAPNPFQPRTSFDEEALSELAESIRLYGLLQPIVVIKKDDNYVLIAGERRLRASKQAGFETIRAVVADIDYGRLRELALIENIQRQDLNPLELAQSFHELIEEHSLTHEALSEIVGKSRAYVTNILRLLQLGEYAKAAIREERVSYGHGKILVGLSADEERKVIDSIANQKLSVRETERLLQMIRAHKDPQKAPLTSERISVSNVLGALRTHGFSAKAKGSSLVIEFQTQKECDAFLEMIE
ncbi:MAG: ParB/RepB/Spo0J family partition protein [Helicobacteraceae bacterium]|nr:ParB/RepB/Spo0J family partition protein [Helicobacteraceae bacterium]